MLRKWYWWDVFKQRSHLQHTLAWRLYPVMNILSQHATQTLSPDETHIFFFFLKKLRETARYEPIQTFTWLVQTHTRSNTPIWIDCPKLPTDNLFTQWSPVGFKNTVTWEQGNFLRPCLPHSHCHWPKIKAAWVQSKHNQPETRTQTL